MPRRRVQLERTVDELTAAAKAKLSELEASPTKEAEELRKRVRLLIALNYDLRELALLHISGLIYGTSARARILEYLRLHVGRPVEGEELDVVGGISEYPRRIRELRVEYGWPITNHGTTYTLERDEPTGADADLWRKMNDIRRSGASARDRMLALFKAFPDRIITTDELRYVAENKDMRRVRELRTELGWRIATRYTGRPDLGQGEYVLVDVVQMEEHDRQIPDEIVVQVLRRDGTACRKAGCGWTPRNRVAGDPRQYIEVHHIHWHSSGGSNHAANLVTLCNVHHDAVHRHGIKADTFQDWLKRIL